VRRSQRPCPRLESLFPYTTLFRSGGAGPLEAARWNQHAAPGKCASSVRGSSGRRRDYDISAPWKKPAPTATGTNSGARTDGGTVKMRPRDSAILSNIYMLDFDAAVS